jgi:hypothetical protein
MAFVINMVKGEPFTLLTSITSAVLTSNCRRHPRGFCRKPLQTKSSFFCPVLQDQYCDKLVSNDKIHIECLRCNLLIESKGCYKGHQKVCGKTGQLGFKCKKCDKFFYRNGTQYKNSIEIADKHTCGETFCRHCKLYYSFSENKFHLCKLKNEYINGPEERLVFLSFSALQNSSYNCITCFKNQKKYLLEKKLEWRDLFVDVNFSNLLCSLHKNNLFSFEPNAICIYKQISNTNYIRYDLSEFKEMNRQEIELKKKSLFKQQIKKIKITEDFEFIMKKIGESESTNVMQQFLKLIFDFEWCNYTFILSDPYGFFLKKLTSELMELNVCPKLINDVKKTIMLEITQLKLRFVTSEMYRLTSNLDETIRLENSLQEHYFPVSFNLKENYNYIGQIPNLEFFDELSDSILEINKKTKFFLDYKITKWKFSDELFKNLNYKCLVLALKCISFINESISMQMQFQSLVEDENPNKNLLLNPFHNSISSFSSYIFKIFKAYFLYSKEIYSIIDEYGLCKRNFSKDELLWAQYKIFENPEKQFRYQFNHPKGQKYFKECIPDLYSPITNEVWFFLNCNSHGHSIEECLKWSQTGFNKKFQNKFVVSLNSEFQNKIQKFKALYPNYEINCTWECHFAQTKQTLMFNKFLNLGLSHPSLTRLIPRSTVRGGYNEVFKLEWNQTENIDETFFCLDINGLKNYCAINFPTNYGHYDILIGKELEFVTIKNNEFFYLDKKIYGAIQLTIIPPTNLDLPFLMYNLKNEKSVLTLCKQCSEEGHQFVTICTHKEIERALTSCYLISEIEYALSLGYKISQIFEIHAYREQKNVFDMFVKCIYSLELKHSNFCENASDLPDLCHKINTELDLPNAFCLEANDIALNKFKKSFYKIAGNSVFEKLLQRSHCAKTKFIATQYELEQIYEEYSDNIFNITCHNEYICQIDYNEKLTSKTRNLKQNCYLAAQIAANARLVMHKHLSELNKSNDFTIYYCDTDSIFGTMKKNSKMPLKIGPLVGEFKHIIEGEILSFFCLGLKNYCITYKDKNGQTQTKTKVCGLNLNNASINSKNLDDLYKNQLQQFYSNIKFNEKLPKLNRPRPNKPNFLETFTLNNNVSFDRQIELKSKNSFPCGYF